VNSHFYTAFDFECAAVKQLAGWTFEANAFYIAADVAQCPASTRPVYRLYIQRHGRRAQPPLHDELAGEQRDAIRGLDARGHRVLRAALSFLRRRDFHACGKIVDNGGAVPARPPP
jgi:hypothetical protein